MGPKRPKGTGGPPKKRQNPNPNKQANPDEPNTRGCAPLCVHHGSILQAGHLEDITDQYQLLVKAKL